MRKKLLVGYNEKWLNDIMLKPKLRTYIQIKHNYETELYVKTNLPRNKRSLIAQLRLPNWHLRSADLKRSQRNRDFVNFVIHENWRMNLILFYTDPSMMK